ncbi:uncharacterized protein LOC126316672 [Schistocerca gregaria]|uniref:uncharacterized protein LOC126316672 n=1 Tax=Schistocerca gregaria TaxID=7010 RepID=UPI00211EEA4D|nr:uncharacterized protein LOC126316672 [Schistocerca gregaria]
MSVQIQLEEIQKHNQPDDLWIIVHGRVYDVTKFSNVHPGGKKILQRVGGKDATVQFDQYHKREVLEKYKGLSIGEIADPSKKEAAKPIAPPPAQPSKELLPPSNKSEEEIAKPMPPERLPSSLPPTSRDEGKEAISAEMRMNLISRLGLFGDMNPYGDPNWYQGWASPYYTKDHIQFRAMVREFIEREIMPNCHEWDEAKAIPKELYVKCANAGWLSLVVGTNMLREKMPNLTLPNNPHRKDVDAFYEYILFDELARCGSGGVLWAISGGLSIGLPPVINFGSEEMKNRIVKPCLMGEKIICLAITEPSAGSDVANISTEAKLTPDGKHFIVNGEKKWITNGVFADYFTVAVRTGGKGMGGISLLLIEKTMPGVRTTQMKCQGVWPSGTTYIMFEDVEVPVENLIGEMNQGFKYIMYNFNHERWIMAIGAARFARVCYEESLKYAQKRKTFGRFLIEHPVIRFKMGHMVRQIEATQAWLEQITYQMTKIDKRLQDKLLGGPIALCKAQSTQTFEFCAREASQILGGVSYTRGGQGEKVERLYREVRAYAIPAGSEEIMIDLGIRQALRAAKL